MAQLESADGGAPNPTAPFVWHSDEGSVGVLLLHGITGSPAAWIPIARELSREGRNVRVPLLPGHGTRWQNLNSSSWGEWQSAARAEFEALAATSRRVIVAGLSMGGALALDLASSDRDVDAVLVVNPALRIDDRSAWMLPVLKHVVPSVAAIGNDIAMPGADEHAYSRTPVRAVASLAVGLKELRRRLWAIEAPVTLCISGSDAVVGPWSARHLRAHLRAPLRTVALRRSRHVATLDFDADLILAELLGLSAAAPASSQTESDER